MDARRVMAAKARGGLKSFAVAAGTLAGCLGIVMLGPLLAVPAAFLPGRRYLDLSDWLFFMPQYVFPYSGTYSPAGWSAFPATTLGGRFDLLQWTVIVLAFGLSARRIRGIRLPIGALLTILVVTVLVHRVLSLTGMKFVLDGP